MRLRWYQSFCTSGGTCTYPKVRAGSDPLIVDITFDGPACDLKLTEFNFRVAVDFNNDAAADEMLQVCEAAGVRLFVVMQNRLNPPNLWLSEPKNKQKPVATNNLLAIMRTRLPLIETEQQFKR